MSLLGPLYGTVAVGLGGWFLYHGVQLLRKRSEEGARRLFRVSLVYLLGIFVAMICDLALRGMF